MTRTTRRAPPARLPGQQRPRRAEAARTPPPLFARAQLAQPPLRVKDTPRDATYQLYEEAGTDLGQALTAKQAMAAQKNAMSPAVAKALGRVSGGLYLVTAARGDAKSAMIASWVAQASFEPLGFTVAVAKDRAIESLMQV
jgi:hypothetical protein